VNSPSTDHLNLSVGLLVVGGGPAGHSAAAAYREAGGSGRVVIVSADAVPPYQRPPLSKDFLRGESDEDSLPLESAEFYRDNDIELWLSDAVNRMNLADGTASTQSGRVVSYSGCVLATGCHPHQLPVPGADHPTVLRLRFLGQAQLLRTAAARAGTVIVIGSGFIGCEAAVSLARRGLSVTMVSTEELPQLHRLGRGVAERISGWLADAGVRFHGSADIIEIREGRTVDLDGGESLTAELILTAAGATPESALAQQAGLKLADGRVVVDERMATDWPGVFAAGDVAFARNSAAGRALRVEHWGEALRMGEVAGRNAAGGDDSWSDVPGFWSQIGDRTIKYASWGDGYDSDDFVEHPGGGFTVWYGRDGVTVGVLTVNADDDDELGRMLIAQADPLPLPAVAAPAALD
jgi:NADPH-dependent 2,4-dienoyl-CoA reductase/sulfur reductase-like enzyme